MATVPGAEVTGELPVPLVDASGVLEMLVPIVLVGEHLAATLALVPLTVCIHGNVRSLHAELLKTYSF